MDDAYLEILRMIENGTLTAAEGENLLDALEAAPVDTTPTLPEVIPAAPAPPPAGPPRSWQLIWVYPAIGGLVLLAGMGILTASLVRGGQALGWLACTLPLMLLGTVVAHRSLAAPVRARQGEQYPHQSAPTPAPDGLDPALCPSLDPTAARHGGGRGHLCPG
jgi:hypothetical protein